MPSKSPFKKIVSLTSKNLVKLPPTKVLTSKLETLTLSDALLSIINYFGGFLIIYSKIFVTIIHCITKTIFKFCKEVIRI
jgi:hypothetical protein